MARDDAAPASGDARLACVDFDLTVLARHSFAERVTVERVEALELRDVEREFVDVECFRAFLGATRDEEARPRDSKADDDGTGRRRRTTTTTTRRLTDATTARATEYANRRGMDVKITSFGKYEVIQAYVDRVLGEGAMTRADISTPSRVGVKDGCAVEGGKNRQIEELLREKYGEDAWEKFRGTVVLFDDDERNVEAAIRAGFRATHTPDGLTKAAIQSVFGDFD
jgi:hypothetical protein